MNLLQIKQLKAQITEMNARETAWAGALETQIAVMRAKITSAKHAMAQAINCLE